MGLFGDVGKFFTDVAQSVVKNPIKSLVAVSTFGSSLVYDKIVPAQIKNYVPYVAGAIASAATLNPLPFTLATGLYKALDEERNAEYAKQTGAPMGLDLSTILGGVSTVFGGNQNPIFNTISNVATLASSFVTQPAASPMVSAVPAVVSNVANRAVVPSIGRGLTQEVFTAGAKLLGAIGIGYPATSGGFSSVLKRALGSMASLARRTPTGTIVSLLAGIGLTAYESNLLVAWHSQRKRSRRMNVCNSKALRRAGRRIRSFHKLCQHLDIKKTVHRRGRA